MVGLSQYSKVLVERENKSKEVAEKLGIQYLGHIMNGGISYFKFQAPSYLGAVYEADIEYIYDLVFGNGCCGKWSIERRQYNLQREFTKAGWFLAGDIGINLKEAMK